MPLSLSLFSSLNISLKLTLSLWSLTLSLRPLTLSFWSLTLSLRSLTLSIPITQAAALTPISHSLNSDHPSRRSTPFADPARWRDRCLLVVGVFFFFFFLLWTGGGVGGSCGCGWGKRLEIWVSIYLFLLWTGGGGGGGCGKKIGDLVFFFPALDWWWWWWWLWLWLMVEMFMVGFFG